MKIEDWKLANNIVKTIFKEGRYSTTNMEDFLSSSPNSYFEDKIGPRTLLLAGSTEEKNIAIWQFTDSSRYILYRIVLTDQITQESYCYDPVCFDSWVHNNSFMYWKMQDKVNEKVLTSNMLRAWRRRSWTN